MTHKIVLLLLAVVMAVSAVTVIPHEHPENWNDTARVAIIWNDGTGNDEMSTDWASEINTGDIGKWTKEYVVEALYHLSSDNIKEYYGKMSGWNNLTLDDIRSDFDGAYPHVIVYVNAGYEWAQEFNSNKPNDPYDIITDAANKGVGIVAVGDDAAYDAKYMFPLTGPGGAGSPIQYDSYYPGMGGAFDYPEYDYYIDSLWLWLDLKDTASVEGGLLWNVPKSKLFFKELEKNGRGQLDADIWDVDTSKLDDFFMIGFQQAKTAGPVWYEGKKGDWSDNVETHYIGNRPGDIVGPVSTVYDSGYAFTYTALAGLQELNHRVAMIGYQPQYLADTNASSQIVYNAVYWASKAHEKLQIATPVADPASGTIQTVDEVTLSVSYPKNKDVFDIYYTLDGSTPTVVSGVKYTDGDKIPIPKNQGSVTLKAIAFSNRPNDWIDSKMLEVTYTDNKKKISAPKANPSSGKTHEVSGIVLTVDSPSDKSLYDIYYTLDESDPDASSILYTGAFDLPDNPSGDVTLKAIAISKDKVNWEDSDIATFTYEHEIFKIDTPKADPPSGKVHEINDITLSVDKPTDKSLYTIYYTVDGSTPTETSGTEYTGAFSLPDNASKDVVLKAIAFSNQENLWEDSDMLTVVYDHVKRKIDTPKADPSSGTTQSVSEIKLTVNNPHDSLWTIYYTFDGSTPSRADSKEYTGPISFPKGATKDVILKAIAFSDDEEQWFDSDMLTVTYEYVGGPLIDSAIFKPGTIEDFLTSKRRDDTLTVYFNTAIEDLTSEWPFNFKDKNENPYTMKVDDQDYDSNKVVFIVEAINGKGEAYLPETMKDSITIDPDADVTSKSGIVQDGSNNFFVPLKVLPVDIDLHISHTWIDGDENTLSSIIKSINEFEVPFDEGILLLLDPRAPVPERHYSKFDCTVQILDPVGNVIATSEGIDKSDAYVRSTVVVLSGRPQVAIAWSAQNAIGRQVGGGSYVAVITFKDHIGVQYPRKHHISVPVEN